MAKVIFDTIIWNNVREVSEDDIESTPKKEIHKILVLGELPDPQYYFAWEYFRYARWVRAEYKATISDTDTPILDAEDTPNMDAEDADDIQKGEDIHIYHVHVTYPSAEEQYDEDRYGFDYDDDY